MKLENLEFNLDEPELIAPEETVEQVEEIEQEEVVEESPEQEDDLTPLAQATYEKYVELGMIDPVDDFDGSFETIDRLMEEVPVKLLNQAIQELPEVGHSVLQFITAGGSSITKEDIIKFVDAWKEENRTSFEMEEDAREYLATKLKEQGLKDSAITAQLNELEDEGELLKEANKKLTEENSKTQKMIESKKEQREQEKQAERQWYSAINEELKALNYSKRKVEDIQKTMSNANAVLSKIYTSPKAVIQLMDLLTKFNGKEFDLSDIEKQGASKSVTKIQQVLQQSNQKSAGVNTNGTQGSIKNDRIVFELD